MEPMMTALSPFLNRGGHISSDKHLDSRCANDTHRSVVTSALQLFCSGRNKSLWGPSIILPTCRFLLGPAGWFLAPPRPAPISPTFFLSFDDLQPHGPPFFWPRCCSVCFAIRMRGWDVPLSSPTRPHTNKWQTGDSTRLSCCSKKEKSKYWTGRGPPKSRNEPLHVTTN